MNLRRIEAESIRDAILAVSRRLDLTLGGSPVPLAFYTDRLLSVSKKADTPTSQSRRALCSRSAKLSVDVLEAFDFPIMAINFTRRTHSAKPLQSLQLLNSEFLMKPVPIKRSRRRTCWR